MRYVLAIGGNAMGSPETLKKIAKEIRRLALKGNQIVVTHGNGPQVGALALHESKSLAELTAQTQAEIGMMLEDGMLSSLEREQRIATVFTRVLVDWKDPAFRDPSKPIGSFYSEKEAKKLVRQGFKAKKLVGGYRRVVASPAPKKILDLDEIKTLLSAGYIVIAGGGGGVAVARRGKALRYLDAVIDKDSTSALLAEKLGADRLLFFTKTDGAYLNYRKRGQKRIGRIKAIALEKYLRQGLFEAGSMGPKVAACIRFAKKKGRVAGIGSLSKPGELIAMRNATVVTR